MVSPNQLTVRVTPTWTKQALATDIVLFSLESSLEIPWLQLRALLKLISKENNQNDIFSRDATLEKRRL